MLLPFQPFCSLLSCRNHTTGKDEQAASPHMFFSRSMRKYLEEENIVDIILCLVYI